MIYLVQNDREYDYDVRAIALAFYERTKIVEVTKEEFETATGSGCLTKRK